MVTAFAPKWHNCLVTSHCMLHIIYKTFHTVLVYFAASTHNLDEFINMDPTKGLGQVMNLTQLVKTFYHQP
jgi:hypothetical protein